MRKTKGGLKGVSNTESILPAQVGYSEKLTALPKPLSVVLPKKNQYFFLGFPLPKYATKTNFVRDTSSSADFWPEINGGK